ncbi:MAG: class I SAM-dependent methyltransferase [Kofleriaceae bacterium]
MTNDIPEISDVVVAFDTESLERRDVSCKAALVAAAEMPGRARRIVEQLATGEVLDRDTVDGILVRSHLELQRLHEEFRVGEMMRDLLRPMIELVRREVGTPVRIVDIGCGLGFVLRWLAARGGLEGVELIGVDYNATLVAAAQQLAAEENLPCRFVRGNAFTLEQPAHIFTSTGVLHHFRGGELEAAFAAHERSSALAFIHADIRPSPIAPLGSWIFHQARMREPLAKFDGYWSTVRAHPPATLASAIERGAPSFSLGMLDARPRLLALLRIFQVAIGVRQPHFDALATMYAPLGRRFARSA